MIYLAAAKHADLRVRLGDQYTHAASALQFAMREDSFRVVMEYPEIYRFSPAAPASIVQVAAAAGVWYGACCEVGRMPELVLPRQWKGRQTKKQTEARVRTWLEERGWWADVRGQLAKYPRSEHNNAYDALGIALWAGAT
jgi:hypothetical protein